MYGVERAKLFRERHKIDATCSMNNAPVSLSLLYRNRWRWPIKMTSIHLSKISPTRWISKSVESMRCDARPLMSTDKSFKKAGPQLNYVTNNTEATHVDTSMLIITLLFHRAILNKTGVEYQSK